MTRHQLSWALYLVGSALVFGSWVDLVPTGLAWFGWAAAIAGWCIGNAAQSDGSRCRPSPTVSRADELAKLSLLHREGVLTDEEFEREKERLLSQP